VILAPFLLRKWAYEDVLIAHNNTGTHNLGLIYMNARYYMPEIGRFISPDTIVPEPGNPQSFNRYAYALNNPIKYNDPSGHWFESVLDLGFIAYDIYDIQQNGLTWTSGLSLAADVAGLALPVVTGGGAAVRALAHADDVADVVTRADEAIEVARTVENLGDVGQAADDLPVLAKALDSTNNTPIIIGEDMDRVQRYANQFGGETISDSITGLEWTEKANTAWITDVRATGRQVIDIGPSFERRANRVGQGISPASKPYEIERRILKGYERYEKAFERAGKYAGGVPGFD